MILRSALLLCLVLVAVAAATPERNAISAADSAALAELVADVINDARLERGLPPLAADSLLASVAIAHSQDMARRGYLAHTSPDGVRMRDRVLRANVPFQTLGENLFRGPAYDHIRQIRYPDRVENRVAWHDLDVAARRVVDGWLDSPGHRENVLAETFARQGVGVAMGRGHTWYVTQKLAR